MICVLQVYIWVTNIGCTWRTITSTPRNCKRHHKASNQFRRSKGWKGFRKASPYGGGCRNERRTRGGILSSLPLTSWKTFMNTLFCTSYFYFAYKHSQTFKIEKKITYNFEKWRGKKREKRKKKMLQKKKNILLIKSLEHDQAHIGHLNFTFWISEGILVIWPFKGICIVSHILKIFLSPSISRRVMT